MVDLPSPPIRAGGGASMRSTIVRSTVDSEYSRMTGGGGHQTSSEFMFEPVSLQDAEKKFELIKEYMILYRDFRRQYDFNLRMQYQLHEHFKRRQIAGQKGPAENLRPQSSVASDSAKGSAKSSSQGEGSQAGDASSTGGGGGGGGGKDKAAVPASVLPQREAKHRQEQEEEMRYRKHLFACEETKQAIELEIRTADGEFKQTQNEVASMRLGVDETENALQTSKEHAGKVAMYARTGKPIAPEIVESLFNKDKTKSSELNVLQHMFIRLHLKKTKLEESLRKLEQVASGLTLNKFEEMRAEARSFSDRLESRTEELNMLRRRRINTVQIISHVKEKLHYERRKLVKLEEQLSQIDTHFNYVRDQLTVEKQQRDKARLKKLRVWMNAGLLTNTLLLRDLDDKVKLRDIQAQNVKAAALKYRRLIANVEKLYQKITASGINTATIGNDGGGKGLKDGIKDQQNMQEELRRGDDSSGIET